MHNGVFTPMHAWIRCEFVGTAAVFQTVQFFGPYASFGLWDCIQNGAAVKLRTTIGITHIGLNRNYQTACAVGMGVGTITDAGGGPWSRGRPLGAAAGPGRGAPTSVRIAVRAII